MNCTRDTLCVVIPAYNAAETLPLLLQSLLDLGGQILVVDDGSTDGTGAMVESLGEKSVSVLKHSRNLGKGAALRTGLTWADRNGYAVAATLDSDLQHSPDDLDELLTIFELNRLDLLIGSRVHDSRLMPPLRLLGNWFSSFVAGRFCRQPIYDSQCGYRIYRLGTCRTMLSELKHHGFAQETEALLRSAVHGLKIGFAPIQVSYPELALQGSHFRPFQDTMSITGLFLRELIKRTFTASGRHEVKALKRYGQSHRDWSGYYMLSRSG
jgi:glycosyltransferase involved in cell wall biosynthesis